MACAAMKQIEGWQLRLRSNSLVCVTISHVRRSSAALGACWELLAQCRRARRSESQHEVRGAICILLMMSHNGARSMSVPTYEAAQ